MALAALALLDTTLGLALLVEIFDFEDGFEFEDKVGVVEVKTLEKFARPFMRLGLFRNGEESPKLPKPRGLYSADIGKFGLE